MKLSVGTDIIEIERIKTAIERNEKKFLTSIYTENEIKYCEARKLQKYQSYAARFAAKEAVFKALSDYIDFEFSLKDFEVQNDDSGKPNIKLNFKLQELDSIEVSISHCKEYAVAYVTAIFK